MGARIFVSYSSKDRAKAERLVSALLLNGLTVWFDQFDILTGDSLFLKIERGLIDVDYVALVLTENSVKSAWVTEEFTMARQRELEERRLVLLPLLFERVDLPLNLRARKHADFEDFDRGLSQLLKAVGRDVAAPELDEAVLTSIQLILSKGGGRDAVAGSQVLRSQTAARLTRDTAVRPEGIEQALRVQPEARPSTTVTLVIHAARARIPVAVDLDERCDHVLARVLRALRLDDVVAGQRVSFFLIFRGLPLEVSETLREAGVVGGAELELGMYSYLIE